MRWEINCLFITWFSPLSQALWAQLGASATRRHAAQTAARSCAADGAMTPPEWSRSPSVSASLNGAAPWSVRTARSPWTYTRARPLNAPNGWTRPEDDPAPYLHPCPVMQPHPFPPIRGDPVEHGILGKFVRKKLCAAVLPHLSSWLHGFSTSLFENTRIQLQTIWVSTQQPRLRLFLWPNYTGQMLYVETSKNSGVHASVWFRIKMVYCFLDASKHTFPWTECSIITSIIATSYTHISFSEKYTLMYRKVKQRLVWTLGSSLRSALWVVDILTL